MPASSSPARPVWTLRRPDPEQVAHVAREAGVPELVAQLRVNRGQDAASSALHLAPDLRRLHDPAQLPDMAVATSRLARAIADGEPILVHGDYDVDGVTGTTLLVRLLRHLGANAHWHIPNRFTDGYSFGDHSIRKAQEVGARVVVSVDNGTSAVETIGKLAAEGIDVIVTDHHEPPLGDLPAAKAIVNPKLHGSEYPFRELCGGAVAFKLAWGLCQELSGGAGQRVRADLRDFLIDAMAYVAIATVCDVVPLIDENRILAHFGLRSLHHSPTAGLRALCRVAKLHEGASAEDIGFQIGPRINASGRLGSAAEAVELLLSDDHEQAQRLATRLDGRNLERRSIEKKLTAEAHEAAQEYLDVERHPVLVVAGQGWHQGVVGITAARLVDRYSRPAIVIGLDGETGRGSARSIESFHVLEAMHGGADHMLGYGGHAQAAGCEVRADAVDALREAVCDRAREMLGQEGHAPPQLILDGELGFEYLTPDLMRQIERLEPFGAGNETPRLLARDVRLAEPPRVVGKDSTHLQLKVRRGTNVLRGMAWGMASRAGEVAMGEPLDVALTPRWNSFRGERSLELLVHDFRRG